MKSIKQILRRIFYGRNANSKRIELRFVNYAEGDRLIKLNEGWVIAKEEDLNHVPGMVYLERRE